MYWFEKYWYLEILNETSASSPTIKAVLKVTVGSPMPYPLTRMNAQGSPNIWESSQHGGGGGGGGVKEIFQ